MKTIKSFNEYLNESITGYNDFYYSEHDYKGPGIDSSNSSSIGNRLRRGRSIEEQEAINKRGRQKPTMDINNPSHMLQMAKLITRGIRIKKATPETLEKYNELYDKINCSWHKRDLDYKDIFNLELMYFLLKSGKLSWQMIGHSKTFKSITTMFRDKDNHNQATLKFKEGYNPTADEFVDFMLKNKDKFKDEVDEGLIEILNKKENKQQ